MARSSHQGAAGRTPSVPAVDRALRILQTLATTPLRLIEIARALQLPKSTTLAILWTLRRHHVVAYDPSSSHYHLGSALLALAQAAQAHSDLRRLSRPVIERLARATEETVILHVPAGEESVILEREESPHQLRVAAPLGHRLSALAGAVAKVRLAQLPEPDAARWLARRRLPRYTPRSIIGRSTYVRELHQVRQLGYATDDEEYLPGVRAVTAPIVGPDGELLGTLSAVGVKARFPDLKMARAARLVREAALEISRELAGRAGPQRRPGIRVRSTADV